MSRADGPLRDRLIFVVGARRSGTNWVQRIITAHPDVVSVPGETYLFSDGVAPLAGRVHHGPAASTSASVYVHRDAFLDSVRDMCDTIFAGVRDAIDPAAQRILERTPDHVRHLDLIGDVYPDARIVHVIRDGRDVARSLVAQSWGPDTIADAAEEWRSAIAAAQTSAPKLQHYVEVRYEDLFTDRDGAIGRLYDALGLSGDITSAVDASNERYNVDQAAQELTTEKWRAHLSADDVDEFMRVAGATLAELGYDTDGTTSPVAPRRRSMRSRRQRKRTDPRAYWAEGQAALDRVLTLLATGNRDALRASFDPNATITIHERRPESLRVEEGIDALLGDPAVTAPQSTSAVYPSYPICVAIVTFLTDGGRTDRTIAVQLADGLITSLAWHRS